MKTNCMIVLLIGLTALMQVGILYRQSNPPLPARPATVRDAPEGTVVNIAGMPAEGSPDSPLVLIEFSDYECPFCKRHATTVRAELKERFVETGQLRYVFANHPLDMHPNATLMAIAAICAGRQGLYWEMHDRLFESGATTSAEIRMLLSADSIDLDLFETCSEGEAPLALIERDVRIAEELGLNGTPGFALGKNSPSGEILIAKLIQGAQPLAMFAASINDLVNVETD